MMKNNFTRRHFIRSGTLAGIGIGLQLTNQPVFATGKQTGAGLRVGIIGLDTSHSVAFAKTLNEKKEGNEYGGYYVVAAYPWGSKDIQSSNSRIPRYTEEIKSYGVAITDSIDELLKIADVILLETNDGRLHLQQAVQVMKTGKKMFIDKPVSSSYQDAAAIYSASKKYNVPVFSASSLRFMNTAKEIAKGNYGKVLGADTFSPATIEKTHPDLFWYGIHGVELLYTIMGRGCKTVSRYYTDDTDIVVGIWNDKRIGTFRGTRKGQHDYGGTVFTEKATFSLGKYDGYDPLLKEIISFFQTGIAPVTAEETLEIYAFMQAADESKKMGGKPVALETIIKKGIYK